MLLEAFSNLGGSVILSLVENRAVCSQRLSNTCIKALCSSSGMHLLSLSGECAWLTLLCREAGKVTVHPPVPVQFQKSDNQVHLSQPRPSAEEELFSFSHLLAMGFVGQLGSSWEKKIKTCVSENIVRK